MRKTNTLTLEVEPKLKAEVEGILETLGLTSSQVVNLLYRQIRLQRGLPFDVRIPNALTARTLKASRRGRGVRLFPSKEAFYGDLGL